jgi:dihydroxyacetone kinase
MEHCGGASGPIWGSAFRGASKFAGNASDLSLMQFADMIQSSIKAIQNTGERTFGRGAVVGDKTLIDALVPFADSLKASAVDRLAFKEAFKWAAASAVEGANNTKLISAKMGRAGTVGERSIGHPDAGAQALGIIFTELADLIQ